MWTLRAEIDHVDAPQMEMMCIPGDQIMVRPRQYTSDLPWARAAHSYPTCVGSVTSTTRSHIRIRMKIPVPSSCHEWHENTMSARTPAFRLTLDRAGCPRRRLVYRGKVVVRSESSCARPARRSFSNTDEPPRPLEITAGRPIVLSVATSLGTIDLLALQLTRLVV